MPVKEAIILAGGLGTRLRSVISDLPKCMAPVAGKPFLHYVINYYQKQGIEKFIFSLGYKHEIITDYLEKHFSFIISSFSIESEPLGTGGAIQLACGKASEKNVLVLNGDTFFRTDTNKLNEVHKRNSSSCTLALKPMHEFDRYGVVEMDSGNRITGFKEKQYYLDGNINGGVYLLNVNDFLKEEFPKKFSFEKDYLEICYNNKKMYGLVQDEYFIDIGIPEDYERAQTELPQNIH